MQFHSQDEILYRYRLLEGWAQLVAARGFSDAVPPHLLIVFVIICKDLILCFVISFTNG
jgi:hypothetical protein